MLQAVSLRCDGCGAPLPSAEGRSAVTCSYCRRELTVARSGTTVCEDASARAVTDDLLRGHAGADVGAGRRLTARELPDWAAPERTLWPVGANASSSYGGGWGADALNGPPRVFPAHGDRSGAWAPRTRDSVVEWIEVDFHADAPPARRLRIFETNLPGASFAVTIVDGRVEELVWRRRPALLGGGSRVLEIDLPAPRRVARVRVYLSNALGSSWSEIDTVGLVVDEPLPEALRRHAAPAKRSSLGCVLAASAVVFAFVGLVLWLDRGDPAEPVPPRAAASLPGTKLMVWNVSKSGLAKAGVVWASEVGAFSSQWGASSNAATRALGPPAVFPVHGDSAGAWAPRRMDDGPEFIDVRFATKVRATAVVIVETLRPGATARVEDISLGQPATVLWEGETSLSSSARVLSVELSPPREIDAIRLVLDTSRVPGWSAIDAVGLVFEPARVNADAE